MSALPFVNPDLTDDPFLAEHALPGARPRIAGLLHQARLGQGRLERLALDLVRQAIANGQVYEELRALFPPNSGWQRWVSGQVRVSERTIRHQRALARFIERYPDLLDRLHPDVTVSALYRLAGGQAPKTAVEAVLRDLRAGQPVNRDAVGAVFERARKMSALRADEPRAAALVDSGRVSLDTALDMRNVAMQFPEPVQAFVYRHAVVAVEAQPLIARAHRYHREVFDEWDASGCLWLDDAEVPLAQASPKDYALALEVADNESYLQQVANTASSRAHDLHRQARKHVANFSGGRDDVLREIERLGDGRRYFVVVYESLDES